MLPNNLLILLQRNLFSNITYIVNKNIFFNHLPISYKDRSLTTFILKDRQAGFFSLFFQVIGALDYCRSYGHNLIVNFSDGLYVSQKGQNWWQCYFNKSCFGSNFPTSEVEIESIYEQHCFSDYGKNLPDQVGHKILNDFGIRPKATINQKVQRFVNSYFRDRFIVGVHYRGTDKVSESELIPYPYVIKELSKYSNCAFYVATDEVEFLQYVCNSFPGKVIYYDALRSGDGTPVHFSSNCKDKYRLGEDALIECLLLSQCNVLMRTESNLSRACNFFNPNLKVVNLSEKYKRRLS